MNSVLVLVMSIAAAVVPTIAYVLLIWRMDRYEKEPWRLALAAFLWGAVPAVLVSALAETFFDLPLVGVESDLGNWVSTGFTTPIVEELAKGIAVLAVYLFARLEYDDVLDGVIYGSIIGIGFAMTENVLYFIGAWQEGGLSQWSMLVLVRAFVFGLNHAMYTSFTGIGFGLARYAPSRKRGGLFVLVGLTLAIITHSIHNTFLVGGDLCLVSLVADWFGVLILFVVVLFFWRRERMWMQEELEEEVGWGVLTDLQYETVVSRRRRLRRSWEILGISGLSEARIWRKLIQEAAELALKKHQLHAKPGSAKLSESVVKHRAQIIRARQALGETELRIVGPCQGCGSPIVWRETLGEVHIPSCANCGVEWQPQVLSGG